MFFRKKNPPPAPVTNSDLELLLEQVRAARNGAAEYTVLVHMAIEGLRQAKPNYEQAMDLLDSEISALADNPPIGLPIGATAGIERIADRLGNAAEEMDACLAELIELAKKLRSIL